MPCYIERTKNGDTMFLCGDFGPHCAAGRCAASTGFLCDYPVGEDRTCDLPLCSSHAYEVAPNVHYCPGHLVLWEQFRLAGGLGRELENVTPFARRPGER